MFELLIDRLVQAQPLHQQVGRADATGVDRPGAIRDLALDVGRGYFGPIRPASIRLLQSSGDSPLACLKLPSCPSVRSKLLM
jgi:hypothetical protein